jgi:hypothetical protein
MEFAFGTDRNAYNRGMENDIKVIYSESGNRRNRCAAVVVDCVVVANYHCRDYSDDFRRRAEEFAQTIRNHRSVREVQS